MFCVNCGVKLADTEKRCPLCHTAIMYPSICQPTVTSLYAENTFPLKQKRSNVLNGAVLILFFIPLLLSLLSDLQPDGKLQWFGFVAGGLLLGYILFAFPFWFSCPNFVVLVPCDFAAIIVYLLYINSVTEGHWFFSFAFPITGACCLITSACITLLRYLKRGKLYILGGAFIAVGALLLLIEFLLTVTFELHFIGWSVYPLTVFTLLGGLMIYLAISSTARERMERKLFF